MYLHIFLLHMYMVYSKLPNLYLYKHAQKEFWESAPVSNFLLSVVWVITDGTDISDETQCDSLRL